MRFLILENYNLKNGLTDDDFIKIAKENGYEIVVVDKITTNDGRLDAIIHVKNRDSLDHFNFREEFSIRKLKRVAVDWEYYGMGKVYNRKEIKRVRETIAKYKNENKKNKTL